MNPADFNVPMPVTAALRFGRVTGDGEPLFTVAAGVPVRDAMDHASCLLDVANDLIRGIGMLSSEQTAQQAFTANFSCDIRQIAWAAFYLIEKAKAVCDACQDAEVAYAD